MGDPCAAEDRPHSLGLGRNFGDDHALLAQGMVVYDALYAWCATAAEP